MNLKLQLKYSLDFKIILVAILYYLAARLGYFLAFENTTALPTWPPSGIAFALIILLGRQTWPGITIGSLVANIMAYWNNPAMPPQTIIVISSLIACCNTFEAVVGNYLVKKWIKSDYPFNSTKNAYRFLFVSLIMCFLGSSLGTCGLHLNNVIDTADLLRTAVLMVGWECRRNTPLHTAHTGLRAKNSLQNFLQKIYGGGDFATYAYRHLSTTPS